MDYTVPYYVKGEERELVLEIDFEEYKSSYGTNLYHLQQNYPYSMYKDTIREDKMEFLKEKVEEATNGTGRVYNKDLRDLMDEIDNDIKEEEEYYDEEDD